MKLDLLIGVWWTSYTSPSYLTAPLPPSQVAPTTQLG